MVIRRDDKVIHRELEVSLENGSIEVLRKRTHGNLAVTTDGIVDALDGLLKGGGNIPGRAPRGNHLSQFCQSFRRPIKPRPTGLCLYVYDSLL